MLCFEENHERAMLGRKRKKKRLFPVLMEEDAGNDSSPRSLLPPPCRTGRKKKFSEALFPVPMEEDTRDYSSVSASFSVPSWMAVTTDAASSPSSAPSPASSPPSSFLLSSGVAPVGCDTS